MARIWDRFTVSYELFLAAPLSRIVKNLPPKLWIGVRSCLLKALALECVDWGSDSLVRLVLTACCCVLVARFRRWLGVAS